MVVVCSESPKTPRPSDKITTTPIQKWLVFRPQDLFTTRQAGVLSRGAGRPSAMARQPAENNPPRAHIVSTSQGAIFPSRLVEILVAWLRLQFNPHPPYRVIWATWGSMCSTFWGVTQFEWFARILRLPLGAARRYYIHRAVRLSPVKRLVGAPSCLWINVEKRMPGSSVKLLWRCFSLRWGWRTVVRGLYCRVL